MTDRATPAIETLRTWHDQQNPLVRALAEPVVQEITEALRCLQAVNDEQAAITSALGRQVAEAEATIASLLQAARSLRDEVEARGAQVQAMQVEHDQALQVAKDRIDQLERHVFGKR